MIDKNKRNFDLTSYKSAVENMISTNDTAWNNSYLGIQTRLNKFKEYTVEQIERIISSGSIVEQQELSRNYFFKSGLYKRIIIYYTTLLKYMGVLIPNPTLGKDLSNKKTQKSYYNAIDFVERMHLPNLFTHCTRKVLVDGCYYGIIVALDKKNFSLLDLPSAYCQTRFKDFQGNDIIEFDVGYFDSIIDEENKINALKVYPKVVQKYYYGWKRGKIKSRWMIIPSQLGVCFPLFEDGRPFFLSVIPTTIKYDEAVETEQERELEEIRKIIVQKIPHLNDGGLLFEPEEAKEMHSGAVKMMGKNKHVSILTTYADVDAIVSKTSADTANNSLEKMLQNIYSETGVSSQLFAATGNLSVESSIKNDTALMMVLANKYSIFISNIVNQLYSNPSVDFSYNILPITYYNESTYINDSFKLAQSGYSYILPALATGFSQRSFNNLKDLENIVLNLGEKLKPLSSAYTQSAESNDNSKADDEKAPKTLQNEESLDNQGGSK